MASGKPTGKSLSASKATPTPKATETKGRPAATSTDPIEAVSRKVARGNSVAPKTVTRPGATVSDQDIAHRAYELFLLRGAVHGFDREDWLQAERELRG